MKSLNLLLIYLLSSITTFCFTQNVHLTESNLPIMIIDTDSLSIVDEPKRMAKMGLIYNGVDQRNKIDDDFNEYNGWIGIEGRGSTSQFLFPKIGYGFETRLENGDNNNVSLLGLPEENDFVLHGPYSDKTLMRSALAYKIGEQVMEYAPRTRFIELIINDVYKGVYVLIEKIKRDKNRVNIAKLRTDENEGDDLTGGYIIKHDKRDGATTNGWFSEYSSLRNRDKPSEFLYHYPHTKDITEPQKKYIRSYIDTLENVLKSRDFTDPDRGYRQYLDPATFIDFMWVNEISRNVDGYRLSTFMYKDKDSKDKRLKMGPVWDFNLAFGNANYCNGGNTQGWAWDFNAVCPDDFWIIHFWWERLRQDPAFLEQAKSRWEELRQDKLSDERLLFCIDSMATILHEAQARNFEQWSVLRQHIWPNNFVGGSYANEVDYLKDWLLKRTEWMDKRIADLLNPPYNPVNFESPNVYPNPTTGLVTFDYYARTNQEVLIQIYNAQGQLIQRINDKIVINNENSSSVQLDGISNIYFYSIWFDNELQDSGKILFH